MSRTVWVYSLSKDRIDIKVFDSLNALLIAATRGALSEGTPVLTKQCEVRGKRTVFITDVNRDKTIGAAVEYPVYSTAREALIRSMSHG